ncbi:hypothetical protein [Gilvibacter sp.]|uniref:hypothetical protein n=1 Tax=Gilvibacter sp. TaxID=2729997 RepID=UPI003B528A7A
MKDHNKKTKWIERFKEDNDYRHLRFKQLDMGYGGYPPYELDSDLIDITTLEVFRYIERDRIPLFVGSQSGIYPKIDTIPGFFNGEKIIGVLAKSLLSGNIAGLTLYRISAKDKEFTYKEIIHYKNI